MIDDTAKSECSQSDDSGAVKVTTGEGNCGGVKAPESANLGPAMLGQGILADTHHIRHDARMIARAAREWNVPDEAMQNLPQMLYDKAVEANTLEAIESAARTLAMLHGQNQAAVRPAPVNQRLTVNVTPDSLTAEQRHLLAAAGRLVRSIPAA